MRKRYRLRRQLSNRRHSCPLVSLTLQYAAPPEKVGDLFARANCIPYNPMTSDVQSFHLPEVP
jgi:hypothetical protein